MKKLTGFVARIAVVGLSMALLFGTSALANENQSPLSVSADDGSTIHIFPTVNGATTLAPLLTGPLEYFGGRVMTNPTIYAIFWDPPTLQSGAATGMSATYAPILKKMLRDYSSHGLGNNNTQYFQILSGITTYVHNTGTWGGAFVDTSPYPASGCTDPQTPGNCVTDAQLRHEVRKAMALRGWTGGINHLFLLFTSSGEGSCVSSSSSICAYNPPNGYCAYHGDFFNAVGTPIIYANEPYGELTHCQLPGAPSPNLDPVADTAATAAAHEVTESITDPLPGSGWVTAFGSEIGDLCAYNYGTLTWDSGSANQMWNGDFFLLQQMFDNHVGGCVQVGP